MCSFAASSTFTEEIPRFDSMRSTISSLGRALQTRTLTSWSNGYVVLR